MPTNVFLTGATGNMGWAGLQELLQHPDQYNVTVLARKSPKNEKKLAPVADKIRIVWGDLMNYEDVLAGVTGADIVLHVGGMVSPMADYYPEKTLKVNVTAAENVVKAILAQPNADDIKAVYIGTVAQTSDRPIPIHWGRTGDPIYVCKFDCYGYSKVLAERVFANSGLKHWVSLRQSGILYATILKNFDPIMFHVPLKYMLEWATLEDSGRLLERVCRPTLPDEFWNHFYNISSGPQYRMTNYEMECRFMKAVHCPPPEKILEPKWLVLKNFHGMYYLDADKLEDYLHFRANIPLDDYFQYLSDQLPWFYNLTKISPAFIIKAVLRNLANKKIYGSQYWIKHNVEEKIEAFYGSLEQYNAIPGWDKWERPNPPGREKAILLDHGYDESKPLSELTISELQAAAEFRGGKLLSTEYDGDPEKKLTWQCHEGHTFEATPKLILEGGHWCPECLPRENDYDKQAQYNRFLAQVHRS